MTRVWAAFRSWPTWAQWAVGVVAVLLVLGALIPQEQDEPAINSNDPTTTQEGVPAKASTTIAPATTRTPRRGPGNPDVYARIEATTDCSNLRAEFNQAMTNAEAREPGDQLRAVSLAYADAADRRMRAMGCYAG